MRALRSLLLGGLLALSATSTQAAPLSRDAVEPFVVPPYALGEEVNDKGVWSLLNSGGAVAGYVFETAEMAPLPGFSGAPINMMVMVDLDGRFIDVKLISHNEPIFVSGLGEAPFRAFLEQYRGHAITEPLVVGTPYGAGGGGSDLVFLDGVTKATASVRIAHESILAATLQVAKEKLQGVSSGPPAFPNPDHAEDLTWDDLVERGLAGHLTVTNAEVNAAFAGTVWAHDDAEADADPDGLFLDLWVVDIGAPSIARAVLTDDAVKDLERFLKVSTSDEPILVIDTARHGLVSPDFVRNTAPDRIAAEQDGLPVALRDADLLFQTRPEVPTGTAMIVRTDRRLGFDPTRDWIMKVQAVREHGMFQPEIGSAHFTLTHRTDARFYSRASAETATPLAPWREAIRNRQGDLILLSVFLLVLLPLLGFGQSRFAGLRAFTPVRLGILAFVTGFVGWWGQGQLSIVTPLAVLRTALDRGSLAYLLYDPFSLLVWGAAILGFVLWGRGLFCGWLCPFGALQEFAHHLGRLLRLPRIEPTAAWDARLKRMKYVVLAALVATVFLAPDRVDKAVEVEPFKTAITTFFLRDWYYVAYAALWLILGTMTFKGFCRYVCPLGAVMAIGGLLRGRDWIARRAECGTPCQLCRVRCNYGSIKRSGRIDYSECFQCLDCVKIHDDPKQCVPLVLAAKRGERMAAE
ncbi:MAG: 4Fe-4S binding protein [Rhodobacteraceae bacterium]|nr:4Fe-4S binding protein [Paracoccaceae bacterium]